jgi:hypothetical protein
MRDLPDKTTQGGTENETERQPPKQTATPPSAPGTD